MQLQTLLENKNWWNESLSAYCLLLGRNLNDVPCRTWEQFPTCSGWNTLTQKIILEHIGNGGNHCPNSVGTFPWSFFAEGDDISEDDDPHK